MNLKEPRLCGKTQQMTMAIHIAKGTWLWEELGVSKVLGKIRRYNPVSPGKRALCVYDHGFVVMDTKEK